MIIKKKNRKQTELHYLCVSLRHSISTHHHSVAIVNPSQPDGEQCITACFPTTETAVLYHRELHSVLTAPSPSLPLFACNTPACTPVIFVCQDPSSIVCPCVSVTTANATNSTIKGMFCVHSGSARSAARGIFLLP